VHLYDGGVSDNLGLMSPFTSLVLMDKLNQFEEIGLDNTKKVVFVIVNAQINKSRDSLLLSHLPDTPRTGRTLSAAMTTIMNSGNFYALYVFRDFLLQMQKEDTATEVYLIHLAFDNLEDLDEKLFFQNVSTALALDEETVEKLIEVGGRLLYKNEEFQRLVKNLDGTIPEREK
jgi:hypothetical protein